MWKETIISKTYESLFDGPHATPKPATEGKIFLRIENITDDGHLDFSRITYISEEEFPRWTKRVKPQENDIVFSYEATLGRYAIIPRNFDGCLGRRIALIRPDNNTAYFKFLYYYFFSNLWKEELNNYIITGSTVDRIPLLKFPYFRIILPPLPIQRKIAAILSAYDDLIENNNRRIAILEKMAEELYREWFVRLRFPGHEKVKIVKGVPEGWEVKRIGDTIEYYIGGGWGEENQDINHVIGAYVIRGTDIPDLKSGRFKNPPFRFHKLSTYETRAMEKGDIIFEVSGGSKGQLLGRTLLITKGIYELCNGTLICASFCKLIRPSISSFFLNYYLQAYHNCGLVGTYQIQSTGISNYQFESFVKYQTIIVPPKPILNKFDSIVSTFISEKDILSSKNLLLTSSRDRLLSRLMSGKIDVENLDIHFPQGMEVPSSPGPFSPWEKGRGRAKYEEES